MQINWQSIKKFFSDFDKDRTVDWSFAAIGIFAAIVSIFRSGTACVYFLGSYVIILFVAAFVREGFFHQKTARNYSELIKKSQRIKELIREQRETTEKLEKDVKHKGRYFNCLTDLHQTAHYIRDCYSSLIESDHPTKETLRIARTHLEQSLDKFATVFKIITGRHCRACIKYVFDVCEEGTEGKPTFYTITLCRTEKTGSRKEKDDGCAIEKNSDFLSLFNKQQNVFLCNDLSSLLTYKNSNWPQGENGRKKFLEHEEHDYISTIVWPIRSSGDDISVVGFLCIDANEKETFSKIDEEVGAIIADILFPIILKYREVLRRLQSE